MANIALPRKMLLGPGTVGQLRTVLSGLGLERPLIVADPFYANNAEVMNKVTHGLRDYDVFSGVVPDPTTDSVQQCVNGLLNPSARRFDSIVALGGGSAMVRPLILLACKAAHLTRSLYRILQRRRRCLRSTEARCENTRRQGCLTSQACP